MQKADPAPNPLPPAKKLLARLGVKPSKRRGQSFLVSRGVAEKITNAADIEKTDAVLEVGPGLGALTECLVRKAGRVVAVESDGRLASWLRSFFGRSPSLRIVEADVLALNMEELLGLLREGSRRAKVVSNIPYSISGPLIGNLLEAGGAELMVLTVQKELARRLVAPPGGRDYGAFSVFCQCHAGVKKAFDIPPGAFYPVPSVTSSVIIFKPRTKSILAKIDRRQFFSFVHCLFSQRRKAALTLLKKSVKYKNSAGEMVGILDELRIDPGARAEHLSPEQFVELYRRISISSMS